MATKLKLKTVFVLYFMVSLLGLVYALMQLGKFIVQKREKSCKPSVVFCCKIQLRFRF